jgi:hypothetical protein
VCSILYLDLLYVGSTHLHGIRANELLRKIYTKIVLQVQKIEDNIKMDFQKEFILTPYNYFAWKERISHSSMNQRIVQVNLEYIYKTDIIHRLLVRLPMKLGPPWKGSLEKRMR